MHKLGRAINEEFSMNLTEDIIAELIQTMPVNRGDVPALALWLGRKWKTVITNQPNEKDYKSQLREKLLNGKTTLTIGEDSEKIVVVPASHIIKELGGELNE